MLKAKRGLEEVFATDLSVVDLVKRVSAYVTQEDIFRGFLTVRETLQFFADLRLDPAEFSPEQKEARVTAIMQELVRKVSFIRCIFFCLISF